MCVATGGMGLFSVAKPLMSEVRNHLIVVCGSILLWSA